MKRFLAESVDFAGSDEILSESEIAKAPGTIMLPITAGMIALAYNIPGINSEIKLPRDVYVEIFAGKIRKWDDPRIQAANPGIAGQAGQNYGAQLGYLPLSTDVVAIGTQALATRTR